MRAGCIMCYPVEMNERTSFMTFLEEEKNVKSAVDSCCSESHVTFYFLARISRMARVLVGI